MSQVRRCHACNEALMGSRVFFCQSCLKTLGISTETASKLALLPSEEDDATGSEPSRSRSPEK